MALVLEDVTEITTLREIIPICSHCRRIRNDRAYWRSVEVYCKDPMGVDFTHGICQECRQVCYAQFVGGPAVPPRSE